MKNISKTIIAIFIIYNMVIFTTARANDTSTTDFIWFYPQTLSSDTSEVAKSFSFNSTPQAEKAITIGLDAVHWVDIDGDLGAASSFQKMREELQAAGYNLELLYDFTPASLNSCDAIFVRQPKDDEELFTSTQIANIHSFITAGGGLLAIADGGYRTDQTVDNFHDLILQYGVQVADSPSAGHGHLVTGFVGHPVTEGISSVELNYQRQLVSITTPAIDLTLSSGDDDMLAVVDGVGGSGNIVIISDSAPFSYPGDDTNIFRYDNLQLLLNIARYTTAETEETYDASVSDFVWLYPQMITPDTDEVKYSYRFQLTPSYYSACKYNVQLYLSKDRTLNGDDFALFQTSSIDVPAGAIGFTATTTRNFYADIDLPDSNNYYIFLELRPGLGAPIDYENSNNAVMAPNTIQVMNTITMPFKAINPNPIDGAIDQSTTTVLHWSNGGGASSYDIYFGTDPTLDEDNFINNQNETTYNPGFLEYNTTYYWRIDAKNSNGTTCGDVWSFTTTELSESYDVSASDFRWVYPRTLTSNTINVSYSYHFQLVPAYPYNYSYTTQLYLSRDDKLTDDDFALFNSSDHSTDRDSSWSTTNMSFSRGISLPYSGTYYVFIVLSPGSGAPTDSDLSNNIAMDPNPIQVNSLLKAVDPSPIDGATDQSTTIVLNWSNGGGATSYDVYFGKDPNLTEDDFKGNQTETTYNPDILKCHTIYYWRIDTRNALEMRCGDIWSFSVKTKIIYVDQKALGVYNGTSWDNAYTHLQDALAKATTSDEIRVAEGIYKPDLGITHDSREATFQLKNGVTIKGGYAGFGKSNPDARDIQKYETILSGDLAGNDIIVEGPDDLWDEPSREENSFHVVTGSNVDETAIIDGFTITAGYANGLTDCGGGMYNINGNPTIKHCSFVGNYSDGYHDISYGGGGGMYNSNSSPTMLSCAFSTNCTGYGDGGGMYNMDQSNPTLIDCFFTNNLCWGLGNGGGIYNDTFCSPTIIDCKFIGNGSTFSDGGAMHNYIFSSPKVISCVFIGNWGYHGGGIYNFNDNAILANCFFMANSAIYGGAIHNQNNSHSRFINCTFTANNATSEGGGICNWGSVSCTLINCILWGNRSPLGSQINLWGSTIDLSYCCVQGGKEAIQRRRSSTVNWGEGNFDADPLLTPDGHLIYGSPCIDQGDPNLLIDPELLFDIDSENRIINSCADIGADEFVDSDDDYLPDWWELKYFWDPFASDPNDDNDYDGLSNLEEYELYSSDPFRLPLHVNKDNIDDPIQDGTNNHSFSTIQDGIDAALDGDTILVAPGTYTGPNNRDLDYRGKSIVLKAQDNPDNTIIDCEYSGRGVHFYSGETQGAALIGFTIVNGLADYGGAILCESSNPQVIECVISNNTATNQGCSMYFSNSTPVLADCIITNNGPESVWMESSCIRIDGVVEFFDPNLYGKDLMLTGLGAMTVNPNKIFDLNDVRLRCNITGLGTIQVGPDSELLIEKDAIVDLGDQTDPELNGQILCDGLLRLKDNARLLNAYVDISRMDVGNNTIIANCIINAEAGVPYGQFYLEDNVSIDIPLIEADGDRYLDLDPNKFDVNNIHIDDVNITITEGIGGSYGGLFELRGLKMEKPPCELGKFICQVDNIPDFTPETWTINRLELLEGAKLNLTNRYDFQYPFNSGGENEVLYVRDLILGEGAILNTAFNQIYYKNLYMADTAIIKNIPLLGFSLNNITFDKEIDYITRITNNNYKDPTNPNFDRIHVERVVDLEPDTLGMMRLQNLKGLDPDSLSYGQIINARAKGLFSKASEGKILIMFEYLFETSDPSTEIVIYLSDIPELGDTSGDNYIEVACLPAPPLGRPGSVGSGRFGTLQEFVSRGDLDFIRGTRIELELIGPDGASVLINNFDPQVHCNTGICMDLNWSNAPDEEDLMTVIGEYGSTAELLPDATNSRACLDGVFSTDGYVDSYDIVSWDWALSNSNRLLNLCPDTSVSTKPEVPINMDTSLMSLANAWLTGVNGPISPTDLTNSLSDLLIVGKRSTSTDISTCAKDRFYLFDSTGQYTEWSEPTFDRGNIRLVKDTENKIYQVNSELGIVKLDGSNKVIVPPGQDIYANEPRYNKSATIYIGIQNEDSSPFGRPILDAAFDADYVYVVPVVVSPQGEEAYLAAARLRLLDAGDPPYQVVQFYDYPFDPNDNLENNPREIEIDGSGNIYIVNVHHNQSDTLWKFSSNGTLLNNLDLFYSESNSYLPDPIAMHVSDVDDMAYLTSGQYSEEPDSITIYGFSKDNLTLERSVTINGMHHVTGITEDPSTGTLWIIGFNMTDIPDYPNPTGQSFFHPCLASIPSGSHDAQITALTGSYDLGLPMSIVWIGYN